MGVILQEGFPVAGGMKSNITLGDTYLLGNPGSSRRQM